MALNPPPALSLAILPVEMAAMLFEAAFAAAARAANARQRRRVPRRGLSLQPGPDTPLWNDLVRQVRPHLRKRGSKAQLGRLLGIPRQRVHACLQARHSCLDAERTLLLLAWLCARNQGRDLLG